MDIHELKDNLFSGYFDKEIEDVYGETFDDVSIKMLFECADGYMDVYTDNGLAEAGHISANDVHMFSAPGRIEVCGNHTDHQNGKIIASAVNIDMVATAGINNENVIRVCSDGHGMSEVDLSALEPLEDEKETTTALIRGVAAALKGYGFAVGGFDAYVLSEVPKGSGLSSSAAFEVLIGNIISGLFNSGVIDPITIAKAGKIAENVYFGKPSGLMDQLACSVGGLIYVDLKDPLEPMVEKIDAEFESAGYTICVTNTGSSHEDLTDAYAQIPADMKAAAAFFGKEVLRDVSESDIQNSFGEFLQTVGERAAKRTIHFINEEERVEELRKCLIAMSEGRGDEIYVKDRAYASDAAGASYPDTAGVSAADAAVETEEQLTCLQQALELICESGDSSFRLLQNVCLPGKANESPLAEALDMSWELLQGRGAFRVHGGGFAGTILAIVPDDLLENYKAVMDERFGKDACNPLDVRKKGGCMII